MTACRTASPEFSRPSDPAVSPMFQAPASTLDKQAFRDAMARLGAAVHIVTTDGPGGRAGFTASAVCSVSDTPPTLLVCLNRTASVYPTFDANSVLCVNTLGADQQALSALFGGKTPMDERFAAAPWHTGITGAPRLEGASVSFECRITQRTSAGTHDVLFCEVLAVTLGATAHALMYFDRRYHLLLPAAH